MSGVDVSASTGRYLSAILLISTRESRAAKTGEIADRLGVQPASVTERLRSLEERDLATYEKYKGARLTDEGERVTRELMWRHCLVENFMEERLDLDGRDARQVGHALSEAAATALKELIDHPCDGECHVPDDRFVECTAEVDDAVVHG